MTHQSIGSSAGGWLATLFSPPVCHNNNINIMEIIISGVHYFFSID